MTTNELPRGVQAVLRAVQRHAPASASRIANAVDHAHRPVDEVLGRLVEAGLVIRRMVQPSTSGSPGLQHEPAPPWREPPPVDDSLLRQVFVERLEARRELRSAP